MTVDHLKMLQATGGKGKEKMASFSATWGNFSKKYFDGL